MVGQKLTDGWKYGAGPLQDAPIPTMSQRFPANEMLNFRFFHILCVTFFVFLRLI